MEGALTAVLNILLGAFALDAVKVTVLGWTRLVTLSLPDDEGDRQLAEFSAELEHEIAHHRRSGRRPWEIAATILVRNGSGAMGDIAEALPSLFASLPDMSAKRGTMRERDTVMLFSAGAILITGTLLGIGGWHVEPNPDAGLAMFILAGIVGIAGGIGIPVTLAAALVNRDQAWGP